MGDEQDVPFHNLKGITLKDIKVIRNADGKDDSITFVSANNDEYRMYHIQDCCEGVDIKDICGDIEDLIGCEILLAEEVVQNGVGRSSETWTFYKLATIKGAVTITWYGSSNGYYSETVSLMMVKAGILELDKITIEDNIDDFCEKCHQRITKDRMLTESEIDVMVKNRGKCKTHITRYCRTCGSPHRFFFDINSNKMEMDR